MMRIGVHWGFFAAAIVLLAACAGPVKAPPPSTDIDEIVFRDHVRVLASDDFEGRKPGTPGEEKTVAYLVEKFHKLGLKPGNGDSYLQQVPMLESRNGSDASFGAAGPKGTLALALGKDLVLWSVRGQPQAELRHSDLVFAGFGIVAPEYSWNDYAGIDVHGKTVVVLANDPGYATKDSKVFRGGTMTYYGRFAYKVEEAARQGAAGVLVVHDTDATGMSWTVIQNTWTGAQLGLSTPAAIAANPAVEGWISPDAARALFGAAGLDFAASASAAAHAGFKPAALGLQADASLHNSVRQFASANVIAQLPGGSRHAEYVMYTAHWDHLGRDDSRAGHNIFNGAVENASGVAGLLTLALSFARTQPVADRSIAFLATTGGEAGLLGSQYYALNPSIPLRVIAGVINVDGLRNGGPTRDLTIFGSGNSDLEESAHGAALVQGRDVTPEPMPQLGLYYRSDGFSFAKAGVPALYAKRGLDDTARGPVWGRAQLEDYLAQRFRQPADQYSADWDVRGAVEDLTLYYAVGDHVAHAHRFPRWYSNSEFRVSRDHGPAP
jgi:Zn-dependent M28 family amino/carboxypeptidase